MARLYRRPSPYPWVGRRRLRAHVRLVVSGTSTAGANDIPDAPVLFTVDESDVYRLKSVAHPCWDRARIA
ncbi:hypothetical protein [Yinghuangia aomiensis]